MAVVITLAVQSRADRRQREFLAGLEQSRKDFEVLRRGKIEEVYSEIKKAEFNRLTDLEGKKWGQSFIMVLLRHSPGRRERKSPASPKRNNWGQGFAAGRGVVGAASLRLPGSSFTRRHRCRASRQEIEVSALGRRAKSPFLSNSAQLLFCQGR